MITIRERYTIDNEQLVEKILGQLTGKEQDLRKIAEFIENNFLTAVFYATYEMEPKKAEDPTCDNAWLDTGLKNEKNEQIFLMLFKKYDQTYSGHCVGSIRALTSTLSARRPKIERQIRKHTLAVRALYESVSSKRKQEEKTALKEPETAQNGSFMTDTTISPSDTENEKFEPSKGFSEHTPKAEERKLNAGVTPIAEELFAKLLYSPWKDTEGLEKLIKISSCQLKNVIESERTQYYAINPDSGAIINTGLLNKYGQPVYIFYQPNSDEQKYEAIQLLSSKTEWLRLGFTKEQTEKELQPLTFYNSSPKDFHPTLAEFDINYDALEHIVDERRQRFPEKFRNQPANILADKVIKELELGLRILQVDRTYAKPIYSSTIQDVSWLLPLHCETGFCERPELVLAIRKNKHFYEIKTILKYTKDVADRIRCITPYGNIW